MQHQLSKGPLLDANGRLNEAGYANSLVKTYDRRAIKAGKSRIKEWDYYLIYNDRFGVALTLDDNSYMGLISASFLDFAKPAERTLSTMFLFPMGKTGFPASSAVGDVRKTMKGARASFTHEGGKRHLCVTMDNFADGAPFVCDVWLSDEPRDSMVIATPFAEKPTAFYYNQKIIAMRAEGRVLYRGERYDFDPKDSFGLLDWGRGVWTYDNTWLWSAAQGLIDGHRFGFNLGYGFGDTTAASENMLFWDGIASKLDRVMFEIPQKDGKDDYMAPWRFIDNEGRLDLTFTPVIDRMSITDLKLICSNQHQVFGRFSGKAVLDDGTEVRLDRLLGFAEKVRNKW